MKHPLLLFDGDCNFCRACVHWIAKHDSAATIHFAPLDSDPGKRILRDYGIRPELTESVIFLDGGRVFQKSEAVFEALRHMRGRWRHLGFLRRLPLPARDFGYDLVSKNRSFISRAVGTINHRYEPEGAERDRFLAT